MFCVGISFSRYRREKYWFQPQQRRKWAPVRESRLWDQFQSVVNFNTRQRSLRMNLRSTGGGFAVQSQERVTAAPRQMKVFSCRSVWSLSVRATLGAGLIPWPPTDPLPGLQSCSLKIGVLAAVTYIENPMPTQSRVLPGSLIVQGDHDSGHGGFCLCSSSLLFNFKEKSHIGLMANSIAGNY